MKEDDYTMRYIMKLNPKYFEYMKNGTKRVEIRLNNKKRKNIKIGDEIIFKKEPELIEQIHTKITNLILRRSFEELIDSLDIWQYSDISESKDKFLEDLYKFYTREQEEKYGVIGIKVELEKE